MRRFAIPGILTSTLLAASAVATQEKPEDAAQKSAETWLALVDGSKYGESWEETASLFKQAVTKAQWEQTAAGVRGPLGKLVSRKLQSRQYMEKLPGAPDGKYVVLQYQSSFEKKKDAVETITPMLDGERGWRVSGYYIK